MLYRKMPGQEESLSILGFGCMRLPQKDRKIDEQRATDMVRHAIDRGVNYLDTALPYHGGQSEPFLARALRDGYREQVKIATKLPPWSVKQAGDMEGLLNRQLKNLDTEHIDYYLLHNINAQTWRILKEMGVRELLKRAQADGRIGRVGFSFHSDIRSFKQIVDDFDWEFCQIQYNFLDRQNQAGSEGLHYAADKGLGVIVMEPLRGGMLATDVPPAVQEIWDQAEDKRTPAEWSLRWIWNHPEVAVVLSGMSTEEQVEENLNIAEQAEPELLSPVELEIVDRAAAKYQELMKVGCTGCRYCMPCPAGVDIPACFEAYNNLHMSWTRQQAQFRYAFATGGFLTDGKKALASQCVDCGKCEEKCPQDLPVRRHLRDVAQEFEGFGNWLRTKMIKFFLAVQRRKSLRG